MITVFKQMKVLVFWPGETFGSLRKTFFKAPFPTFIKPLLGPRADRGQDKGTPTILGGP